MIGRHETVVDPGFINVDDLLAAVSRVMQNNGANQKKREE